MTEQILHTIIQSIEVGVPHFNNGNYKQCADLYEETIMLILNRTNADLKIKQILQQGLAKGQNLTNMEDRAWAYRDALDAAIRQINTIEKGPESTSLYKFSSSSSNWTAVNGNFYLFLCRP